MKRMFGEYVSARKFPNMVKEMFLKRHYILKSLGLAVPPFTTLITVNVPVCADTGCALVLKYVSYGNSR